MFDRFGGFDGVDDGDSSLMKAVAERRQGMLDTYLLLAMIVAIYESNKHSLPPEDVDRFRETSERYTDAMSIISSLIGAATHVKGDKPIQVVIGRVRMEALLKDLDIPQSKLMGKDGAMVSHLIDVALGNIMSTEEDQVDINADIEAIKVKTFFSHLH